MSLIGLLRKPLDRKVTETLVAEELARVLAICQPGAVYLFGSAARGEMTDQSDIDLLIIFDSSKNALSAKKSYYSLPCQRSYAVDILFLTDEEFKLRSETGGVCMVCAQEGKLIYGAVS